MGFTGELTGVRSSESDLKGHDLSQAAERLQFQDVYRQLPF